jgi:regulator of protease activity HflC (stomatin/prohibitin superfamily)
MLDRLIDLLVNFIDLFKFWEVVDIYELGVVLRWGRFHRELNPGFHWKIPFGIEKVLTDVVVPTTLNLGPQSLTTKDNIAVVVSGIVTFQTSDVKKLLLEVESANHVLEDNAYGVIARYVITHSYQEITSIDAIDSIKREIRKASFKFGIEVTNFSFSDVTMARSYRLFQDGATKFISQLQRL